LVARLAARRADMEATLDAIRTLLDSGAAPEELLSAQDEPSGWGFAAVDSARGRLYHALRLDSEERIADYRIVAPTEWNFHPEGPFARLLRGARIGAGPGAKKRIERLAFVFDPCIRACAEVLDEDHA
jgi:coenzyme F420-reducing hydrogenase alpha subunit